MVRLLITLAATAATGFMAPELDTIEGDWANASNTVVVRVEPCADALCGYVTWASQAAQDDAFRAGTVRLVGTQLMNNFVPTGPDRWRGSLFVPDMRRTTRARLIRTGPDELAVVGCELAGLICKKQIWHRTVGGNRP